MILPVAPPAFGNMALVGLVTAPTTSPYTLSLTARVGGALQLSLTIPRGDGTFVRGTGAAQLLQGGVVRVVADLSRPDSLVAEIDGSGDGIFESHIALSTETVVSTGPHVLAAAVIGPETLAGASPMGTQAVALFDRVVADAPSAATTSYEISSNSVSAAKRQLSGRLVFLGLARPEGPYVPQAITIHALPDARGVMGDETTVPLVSRIQDPGAVVTGQVRNADGTPVGSGTLYYWNNTDTSCYLAGPSLISGIPLGADGSYELRYVRQDNCGTAFSLRTQDPVSGQYRSVSSYVRFAGERIVLDLALLGRGSVAGTVTDSQGPVGGATVVALSLNDTTSGGSATTDGNGHYQIDGLTVGQVSVKAVHGINSGVGTGRVDRAGTTATVNVALNDGNVGASGRVREIRDGHERTLAGVYVVFYSGVGVQAIAAAVTQSDSSGKYAFSGMPAGTFHISTYGTGHDVSTQPAVAAAGQQLTNQDLVIVINGDGTGTTPTGTIKGLVQLPDHSPALGAIVTVAGGGVVAEDGTFTIPGVPVKPTVNQTVTARSGDGLRSGSAPFQLNDPGEVLDGIVITLSGLGGAAFTVENPDGSPVNGQEVRLLNNVCSDECGCEPHGRRRTAESCLFPIGLRAASTPRRSVWVRPSTWRAAPWWSRPMAPRSSAS